MATTDLEAVKEAASQQWPEIISRLTGVSTDILDGKHHPCPKCGGSDRFRFFTDGTGGALCNQCFSSKNGDGISVVQWLLGVDFKAAAKQVADEVGIDWSPSKNGKKKEQDPEKHLEFRSWNDTLVALWSRTKPPIQPVSVKSFGGRLATYRGQYTVVAIPIWGPGLDKPVGWVLYNINGKTLPVWSGSSKTPTWKKVKITNGSKAGIVCERDRVESATVLWKVEGVTDALALSQIVPPDQVVVANTNGAKERPQQWIAELAAGKKAYVIHDCDRPGQDGATHVGEPDGKQRPGWAPVLACHATEARNIVLPYAIAADHGKDLRDWLTDGNGWSDLELLADRGVSFEGESSDNLVEHQDDPHRLARINLHQYAMHSDGATLAFWRSEWYSWKRTRYRKIGRDEFRAKLSRAIKKEFDRQHLEDLASQKDEVKPVQKISRTLINDVVAATESLCVIPEHVEMGTWIDGNVREKRNYISFQNGILDIESLFSDEENVALLEHSPKWFSNVALPYSFDPSAECPTWFGFLRKNLEDDIERINVLQEWAGYLLTADTGHQMFLVLEGEGANGKSVYCAAIEAMLGKENCAHVSLEVFGDRFSRTQTLGKLVNISSDAGEIDKMSEGHIKSFVGGETMYFDRKGVAGLDAHPTARLMIACNNRPRFTDRSSGMYRRMKVIPWNVQIPIEDRVRNMDKPWWWEGSGELPGVFRWALAGLKRLRDQGGFSHCAAADAALEEYQDDMNPARVFLNEQYQAGEGSVPITEIYDRYKKWAKANGNHPLASNSFGREVRRTFKSVEKVRKMHAGAREFFYEGLESKVSDDF